MNHGLLVPRMNILSVRGISSTLCRRLGIIGSMNLRFFVAYTGTIGLFWLRGLDDFKCECTIDLPWAILAQAHGTLRSELKTLSMLPIHIGVSSDEEVPVTFNQRPLR